MNLFCCVYISIFEFYESANITQAIYKIGPVLGSGRYFFMPRGSFSSRPSTAAIIYNSRARPRRPLCAIILSQIAHERGIHTHTLAISTPHLASIFTRLNGHTHPRLSLSLSLLGHLTPRPTKRFHFRDGFTRDLQIPRISRVSSFSFCFLLLLTKNCLKLKNYNIIMILFKINISFCAPFVSHSKTLPFVINNGKIGISANCLIKSKATWYIYKRLLFIHVQFNNEIVPSDAHIIRLCVFSPSIVLVSSSLCIHVFSFDR